LECITNDAMGIIPVNKQEVVVHMKSKIRWFNNDDVFGYIEYKPNGDVVVCFSNRDTPEEHVKLELIKKDDTFELKRRGLD